MANNTGLQIQNTTANTITVDLFDQGQSGDNVPQEGVLAKSGNPTLDTVGGLPASGYDYYYTGTDFTTTEYKNIDPSLIRQNSGSLMTITWSDNSNTQIGSPLTYDLIETALITQFNTKNGTTGQMIAVADAKLKFKQLNESNQYVYDSILNIEIRYLTNPNNITYLVKTIAFVNPA